MVKSKEVVKHLKSVHVLKHGVPINAFYKYVDPDLSVRRKLGSQVGQQSKVSEENAKFMVQHTIRADRANAGLSQS